MINTKEIIPHSELDPEVTIVQEGHTQDYTTREIEVTVDKRGSEVNSDHQLEDLELHQGYPTEIKKVFQLQTIWSFCYRMSSEGPIFKKYVA